MAECSVLAEWSRLRQTARCKVEDMAALPECLRLAGGLAVCGGRMECACQTRMALVCKSATGGRVAETSGWFGESSDSVQLRQNWVHLMQNVA